MNVDQAYAMLRDTDRYPTEAARWAVEHWDEASDRLLSKLRMLAAKLPDDFEEDSYDEADAAALHALAHLFAEKKDTRAYGPLCDRLLRDRSVSAWLGNAVDTTLPGVFIGLCDGDLEPLRRIVERVEGDEGVRYAAFDAYAYLVKVSGLASGDEARSFLADLLQTAAPRRRSDFWLFWAQNAARLGFADLAPDVARLLSKSWISPDYYSVQDFNQLIGDSRADPVATFAAIDVAPFGSTVEMYEAEERSVAQDAGEDYDLTFGDAKPYVNDMRDIGRNDPCPCGSGKNSRNAALPNPRREGRAYACKAATAAGVFKLSGDELSPSRGAGQDPSRHKRGAWAPPSR